MNESIRGLAICLFQRDGKILVSQGYDPLKDQFFYRPLGGAIEFGEYSRDTVVREMREEINAEVKDLRYLFTLENIFTFNGQPGHEIVQVYDGAFCDESLYAQDAIEGIEFEIDQKFQAVWKPLSDFVPGFPPLYPDGLAEALLSHAKNNPAR